MPDIDRLFDQVAGASAHLDAATLGRISTAFCWRFILAPPDLAANGEDVWQANAPDDHNGVMVLGTPLGRPAYVRAHAGERVREVLRGGGRVLPGLLCLLAVGTMRSDITLRPRVLVSESRVPALLS